MAIRIGLPKNTYFCPLGRRIRIAICSFPKDQQALSIGYNFDARDDRKGHRADKKRPACTETDSCSIQYHFLLFKDRTMRLQKGTLKFFNMTQFEGQTNSCKNLQALFLQKLDVPATLVTICKDIHRSYYFFC